MIKLLNLWRSLHLWMAALFLLAWISRIWAATKFFFESLMGFFFGLFLIFFIPFAIGNFLLATPRVQAYRNLHPSLPVCQEGLEKGWSVLAAATNGRDIGGRTGEEGWVDPTNDEIAAVRSDREWGQRLRCAIQHHVVPAESPDEKPIDYYLSFLEFRESGEPYSLIETDGNGADRPFPGDKLLKLKWENAPRKFLPVYPITQLDVLMKHLSTGSNYVIALAHGWRHDASIGDRNVADLRHYAAHAVRFLAERCKTEGRYCDTRVTAIYIGWRGARVNESGLRRYLGDTLGGALGGFAAGATLFDRKPVSEQVAPAAISALRALQREVLWPDASPDSPKPGAPVNKMVVFGHSLGGNLFATGLEDDLIKSVRLHKAGNALPPVLGNLVVLLNPASEASKWTSIQREVWSRVSYFPDSVTPMDDVAKGHDFFPDHQKPVIVSVTAALAFPAGGLREGDCQWIFMDADDRFKPHRKALRRALAKSEGMFEEGIEYDWATHDLFPAFKFDFRPLALWFDRWAARLELRPAPGQSCGPVEVSPVRRVLSAPARAIATTARHFPFQNWDQESSHTIGHLDPPRPAGGVFPQYHLGSAAPFGTTHELMGVATKRRAMHIPYGALASATVDCPATNRWLTRARQRRAPHGTFWDSDDLAPSADSAIGEGPPAAQFMHGFNLGGTAAITRANDPFWNVRAFDNALSRHDGYRMSSFICAINQLVMDDITQAPPAPAVPPPSLLMTSPSGPIRLPTATKAAPGRAAKAAPADDRAPAKAGDEGGLAPAPSVPKSLLDEDDAPPAAVDPEQAPAAH